jgi:iron complex outermembrane receptor protein
VTLSGGARFEYAHTQGENLAYNKAYLEPFIWNPWLGWQPNPNYPAQPIPDESFDENVEKQGWAADASIIWRPNEEWSLWGGYDMLYRYPALDEVASYQGFPLDDPFNSKLDPETGNSLEAGASATLFYLLMDDEIAFEYDPITSKGQNVNIGSTERFGSDLELAYEKTIYGTSAMLSLVRATFDGGENDGEWVPLVPDATVRCSLWIEPRSWIRLTGSYDWTASQFQGGDNENDVREIPAYGLFGLKVNVYAGNHVSVYAKVENLLDKEYISSAYFGGYYPGSGRAFHGGLKVKF